MPFQDLYKEEVSSNGFITHLTFKSPSKVSIKREV